MPRIELATLTIAAFALRGVAGCQSKEGACPNAALDGFSAVFEGHAPRGEQADAITALGKACPSINEGVLFGVHLEYGTQMMPDPRSTFVFSKDEAYNALMRGACSDGQAAAVAHQEKDDAGIYEACDFQRFDVLEAGESYSDDDRAAFVLIHALVTDGTDKKTARRAARALIKSR